MQAPTTRLIPASQWNAFHLWPPKGGLRYLIFHEKTNGFDTVVRRCGRRVLIDESAFFAWVRSRGARIDTAVGPSGAANDAAIADRRGA